MSGRHLKPGKPLLYRVATALVVMFCALLFAGQFGIGGLRSLSVQSSSMEPSIGRGSIVFTVPVSSPQIGNVVTFQRPGETEILITHRIVDVRHSNGETAYITKGDANENADREPVPPGNVVGKVWLTVPWLGVVIDAARTRVGFIFLVIVPATIIVHNEILSLRDELKKRRSRGRAFAT